MACNPEYQRAKAHTFYSSLKTLGYFSTVQWHKFTVNRDRSSIVSSRINTELSPIMQIKGSSNTRAALTLFGTLKSVIIRLTKLSQNIPKHSSQQDSLPVHLRFRFGELTLAPCFQGLVYLSSNTKGGIRANTPQHHHVQPEHFLFIPY